MNPIFFDKIFAVFDRDEHNSYVTALQKAESLDQQYSKKKNNPARFHAIPSIPCFELWLLLHFINVPTSCKCNDIIHKLKQHIPNYEKGFKQSFSVTQKHLDTACKHVEQLKKQHHPQSNHQEPYTAIDDLVTFLINMKYHR